MSVPIPAWELLLGFGLVWVIGLAIAIWVELRRPPR
jgi:hypothetical protein